TQWEGVTMVWQVILCGLLAISESGDWSSFLKAEQLFYEVYGKKIEAAKTPEAKAALAKELLELAKKETDQLAKRVELEQAKRLAVEAEAVALAVDIVRTFIEAFPETTKNPETLIDRAEELWKEGESKQWPGSFTWHLDAIELFLKAAPQSPLISQKWEQRISELMIAPFVLREPYSPSVSRIMSRMAKSPVTLINATSGYTMNVGSESRDIGAMVLQFPILRDKILPSCRWLIQPISVNKFVLRNYHSGLVLTWKENSPHLVQDLWRNDIHQQWRLLPTKNNCFIIQNCANFLYVAPPPDRVTDDVALGLYPAHPEGGIFWKIVPSLSR
ncbi:MAG: RICIN domain-containing protein, partial [Candidatus Methanomethylicaceae archaeon]